MAIKQKSSKKKFVKNKLPLNLILTGIGIIVVGLIIFNLPQKQTITNYAADPQPLGPTGTWNLQFDDEFENASLDNSKWTPCFTYWNGTGCNHSDIELQWYQPANVTQSGGILHLLGQKQTVSPGDGRTYNYTSGMIASRGKFSFKYGYVEIRFKSPNGKGYWPAFWTLPEDNSWPPEIDVVEILGHEPNKLYMTYHWLENGAHKQDSTSLIGPNLASDFHTYGYDWQPNALVWYIDGVEKKRFTDVSLITSAPMYLIANLAIGGEWPGNPDASTIFPQSMDIDYIRVWQKISDASPSISTQPSITSPALITPTVVCLGSCIHPSPSLNSPTPTSEIPSPTLSNATPTEVEPTLTEPTIESSPVPSPQMTPTTQPNPSGNNTNKNLLQILLIYILKILQLLLNFLK